MKKFLVVLSAMMVVMLLGSIASAETVSTYAGVITVKPGIIPASSIGEVGTLLNATDMGNLGVAGTYHAPSFPGETAAVQTAGSTLDHAWVQSKNNEIKWSLNKAVTAIYAIPGTDHGPLPAENMEFKMWGSNDGTNWTVGLLTAIYADGWDAVTGTIGESDAYSTRWDFTQSYKYFKSVGEAGVVTGWTDFDPEMDGIAAVVPEPMTMLLLGFGLVGLAGVRRFKK